ncbi:MAG: hypothetical protein GF364_22670 [Candidatus Lokiarchaeota archaeon]|nr:hypothetical protein [Candidatus Lokiarchaeota archaeon]
MTVIVAHVGDLHVNSSVGLMPPRVTLDDGQTVLQSATQHWLWDNWLDYWKRTAAWKRRTKARVVGIINGDWGDINVHSQFQLIEPVNPDIVLDMMTEAVEPMRRVCDAIFVVRGTEAHTGGSGFLENRAAKEIGAEKNAQEHTHSWYLLEAEFEGVKLTSSHHPGTSSRRPWTKGNDTNRRAAMDIYNYGGSDWVPDLTLWGHYHYYSDSGNTHSIRAIYNRSWQVKTAFSYRLGLANNVSEIGGLWVFCHADRFVVRTKQYRLPRPEPVCLS